MEFLSEMRPSDVPWVDLIWQMQSLEAGTFVSQAQARWEMVVTRMHGQPTLTLRGPETHASPADCPPDGEFLGIAFKIGTFMPHFPTGQRLNRQDITLGTAGKKAFWLRGAVWELPTFDNADVFVERLIREGVLAFEPLVAQTLAGQSSGVSLRSVQRRFLSATGLPHKTVYQIQRAHTAKRMLLDGCSTLDTAFELGYSDQPHLTRSLRRFLGQTPTQILHNQSFLAMENPS